MDEVRRKSLELVKSDCLWMRDNNESESNAEDDNNDDINLSDKK